MSCTVQKRIKICKIQTKLIKLNFVDGTFICYFKSRQYEGNIRQTQVEENSIKYKKCQDNQKEGKCEKPSQSKEPKETW